MSPVPFSDASPALGSPAAMLQLLARWAEEGWLRQLDRAFAAFLADMVADASPLLLLTAALASHQLGRGHVCLDLADTLLDPAFALSLPPEGKLLSMGDLPPVLPAALLRGLELATWQAALVHPLLVDTGPGASPLLLIGRRVYLRRYWQYEQDVRHDIDQRLAARPELALPALAAALTILFPRGAKTPAPDWQRLACALAVKSGFSVITGGPGTGKTTTVVRLLALLQALALGAGDRALRIRLAAPTGKAAARLNESIAGAVEKLQLEGLAHADGVRAAIPLKVATLHRLLGSRPDSRHFRHHAGNPLALDVLVVDEASMVDLEMMAAVLAALPPGARLVLLGDKDQLASVEAGAVLGELCRRAEGGHYLPETRDWLLAVAGETLDAALVDVAGTPRDQCVAMLRHSHRFDAESGIGQLAAAINAGNVAAQRAVLAGGHADLALALIGRQDAGEGDAFRELVVEGGVGCDQGRNEGRSHRSGYRHYLEVLRASRPPQDADDAAFDRWALTVLKAHGEFQLLCALRSGPWGVEGLNPRIAALLAEAGLISASEGWYAGRPVLVTRNDYALGLMNGDIGIALERAGPEGGWMLRVAFADGDGGIKWVLPSRLQGVETVFALTVHKSQGSEFVHAALLVPDSLSPILTRELIYTGITRARSWLTLALAGSPRVLEEALQRRVLRKGGLQG